MKIIEYLMSAIWWINNKNPSTNPSQQVAGHYTPVEIKLTERSAFGGQIVNLKEGVTNESTAKGGCRKKKSLKF
jgi:hypothetical protein